MVTDRYLMESGEEALRLDMKTDGKAVERQALWAGIKPGMRVADLGFGSGKTAHHLAKLVQPHGEVVGVDFVQERINFAKAHYSQEGIEFILKDIRAPLEDLGEFDFIWVRFVLEYHNSSSFHIVKNISKILKPGGILCLLDLDHNCQCHFGHSKKLERTIFQLVEFLVEKADFDPYVGRKLYSFLYDLNYEDIDVAMSPHHLIYGDLNPVDSFNWGKKAQVAANQMGFDFDQYKGGYDEFCEEFTNFFADPRRFTYTPLLACRGKKPLKQK